MNETDGHYLSTEEERLLLQIARDSLDAYVRNGEHLPLDGYPLTPRIEEKHGAFVRLHSAAGKLRGCIGHTKNLESLAEAVCDNAIGAGTRDPRFAPLSTDELAGIRIEIAALCPGEEPGSPFVEVQDLDEIVIGRDGLYLDHAGPRGGALLLPQIPLEEGWDRDRFLAELCSKAGVPDRAWEASGATLYRFSAQVFGE